MFNDLAEVFLAADDFDCGFERVQKTRGVESALPAADDVQVPTAKTGQIAVVRRVSHMRLGRP